MTMAPANQPIAAAGSALPGSGSPPSDIASHVSVHSTRMHLAPGHGTAPVFIPLSASAERENSVERQSRIAPTLAETVSLKIATYDTTTIAMRVMKRPVEEAIGTQTATALPHQSVPFLSRIRHHIDPRYWVRTILHLDDSPHSIALGTSIGLFVGITPTGGIQMALVLLISLLTSWLFRFNRIAALLGVYVSNPLTTIPIGWYCYKIGTLFFPDKLTWDEFKHLVTDHMFDDWWMSLKTLFVTVGLPLFVGSLVVGAVVGVVSYPVVYLITGRMQKFRQQQLRESSIGM